MKVEKKRLIFILGGVLLFLVGFVLGRVSGNNGPIIQPTASPTLSASLPPSIAGPVSSPTSETFKVTRVIDGDTIELENNEHVRYIGIDTPETVDPRKPVQCFGIEASKKNKELVEGKTVRLEKDITDRDKYGRLLRYIYIGDLFINLELVKQGFAHSYTYPPDVKYQKEILVAEKEAREANRGLWGACPIAVSPVMGVQETQEGGRP